MSRFALVVLLTHSVLVQAVTFVLRPTSTYRALELGVPATWLGVLSASFAIAPLVLAVPSGHAVDRLGERRVMLAGSVLIGLAAGAFVLFGGGVAGLVAGSVLLGIGHLCSVVGQQALVANRTPAGRHDAAFGYYTFAASLGQALGPSLILVFGGTRTIPATGAIFLSTLGLAGVLLVVTLLVRPSGRGQTIAAAAAAGGVRTLLTPPGPAARADRQLRRARRGRHHAGLSPGAGHRARHRLRHGRGAAHPPRGCVDDVAPVPGPPLAPARPAPAARSAAWPSRRRAWRSPSFRCPCGRSRS